ncbi:ParA family protein [Micromonospora sp. NPDC050417]|uniref:ParA family protein n=1 Tax=Micromonospora sp. NPDC050417 TaxID=3364280 RepID=UPI0037B71713
MNYKGGVGKTTLTANLGAEIANTGRRVLLLDLDPQANLTFSFYTVEEWQSELRETRTIKRWYDGEQPGREVALTDLVVTPPRVNAALGNGGRLDLIPSHLGLINIDLELAAQLGGTTLAGSKRKFLQVHGCLAAALHAPAFADYDLILIDCAPNFGLVTKTAIVASGHVLIPARADYLSTLGIGYMVGSCEHLRDEYNAYVGHDSGLENTPPTIDPNILGVVFTMIQTYAGHPIAIQHNAIEQVRANAEAPVLGGMIRNSPRVFGEAGAAGIPAILRVPKDDEIAIEFRILVDEFLGALGR